MANLTESPVYESGIFQLEKSTPAVGGAPVIDGGIPSAGHANAQAQQLANRSAWLKSQVDKIQADILTIEGEISDIQDTISSGGSATSLAADLANNTDPTKGAALTGVDGTTVASQLLLSRKLSDYTALRAYTGPATRVEITSQGFKGVYQRLGVVGGYTDDGGFHIISSGGVVWERQFTGTIKAIWFRDGTGDDTLASSLAAKAAVSFAIDSDGDYPLVPYCPWATVEIPNTWTVTSEVDTGNKEIVWKVPVGCTLTGAAFMNGRILRDGNKITDFHHGILDSATGFSVMSNRKLEEVAPVGGIGTASRLSNTNGRDTVGAYFGNRIPAPTYTAAAVSSYTSTSVVLSTPMTDVQLRRMRRGMIIHTKHATRYAGYVGSWTANTINVVGGWFLMDGSPVGTATTPAGTTGVDVNVFRKGWGFNSNVFIDADSYGTEAVGGEIGVSNSKGQSTGMGGNIATYGVLIASLTADSNDYYNTYASITGGRWVNGYTPIGGVRNAFVYRGDLGRADELQSLLTGVDGAGATFFNIDALGNIEAGKRGGGAVSPWLIDMHSSGNVNDYDSRISSTGGTSANGAAVLAFLAGQVTMSTAAVDFTGVARPAVTGVGTLGQASRAWSTGYVVTAFTVTSDKNYKQQIADIDDKCLDAWELVNYQQYKLNDAVKEKGKTARFHIGVVAQEVKAAFEKAGVDPFLYGILCYDKWESEEEILDELGNIVSHSQEAGERYSIRYEEALCLEAALLRRTKQKLESRMAAIETALKGE